MEQLPGSMKPQLRILLGGLVYILAYIISTTASLNPPLATIWLCSGVSLYILLRLPLGYWWIMIGTYAIIDTFLTIVYNQLPLKFTMISLVSNATEPLMAALFIRHFSGRRIDISQLRHVILLLVGIWLSAILTGISGAYAVWLIQGGSYLQATIRWALSCGIGGTLVVWGLLAWTTPECYVKQNARQLTERIISLLLVIITIWAVYYYPKDTFITGLNQIQLRIPLMLWILMRYGPRMVSLTWGFSVLIICMNTAHGYGPFVFNGTITPDSEITLLLHLLISITQALLLSSVITDRSNTVRLREENIDELRRTQRNLEILIDSSPLPTLMLDSRNHVQIWNKAAERIFGWHVEEVLNVPIPTIPDTHVDQHQQFAKHVREGGILNGVTVKRWCKDGSFVDVQIYVAPLMSQSKAYEGCVVVYLDISETLRVEREANELRNLLQNMIDSMPSVLAGVDMQGNITHWNKEATKLTGLSSKDALGQPIITVLPMLDSRYGAIQSAIEKNEIVQNKRVQWEAHGKTMILELTAYPFTVDHNKGVVIRLDDVTERIRLTEAVIQSEKMMSVGGLAAGMAHEINNPLAGMMQCAQVIQNRLLNELPANVRAATAAGTTMSQIKAYALSRELPDLLEDINETGGRAARIVDNMLRYTRKDEGQYRMVDINSLLDKTLEISRSDYDLRKRYDFQAIEIERDYGENLPLIQCQETEIQQVLLNLVKNATEAMWIHREEISNPKLTLRTLQIGDDVQIEVEDNGRGIEKAVCRRLFEPFFTTKPAGVGTGLGLSVSSYIVTNNHGGSLKVFSEVGKGARFVIKLPQKVKASQT